MAPRFQILVSCPRSSHASSRILRGFRALAVLLLLAGSTASWADTTAVDRLAEQARFWEQRNRPALAVENWQRLLDADPDNEEALGRLAILANSAGDAGQAQAWAARLRAVNPQSRFLRDIQASQAVLEMDPAALARARRLAADQNTAGALEAYGRAFGGPPPTDPLRLEFYQVLAADDARRDEALRGLRELVARNPDAPEYALALARQQTYRPATRREGIRALAQLQSQSAIRDEARAAWRQALLWLDAGVADEALYDQYLRAIPGDEAIGATRERLRAQRPDSPQRQREAAVQRAFARLDAGADADAERQFNALLKQRPNDAAALGGLGLVRLRQQRYDDADTLLGRAMSAQPGQASRWQEARRSARFFKHFEAGTQAREAGDLDAAQAAFRTAFSAPPKALDPALRTAYADVLLQQGDSPAAEQQLRLALKDQPGNTDAQRQLAQLLARSNRLAEAERLVADAPPSVQAAIAPARAEALREQAKTANQRGETDAAARLLRQALALSPNSPWVRLDLARLARARGDAAEADRLLDSLRQTHPDLPDIALMQAYGLAEDQRWLDVLYELERMPLQQRNRDASALQRRAWIQYQLQRAGIAAEAGDLEIAYRALVAADTAAGNDPEHLQSLAGAWAGVGDPARALAYLRHSFEGRPASAGQRLQYAALLLQLGQDVEFESTAEWLLRQPLTAEQSQTLEGLIVDYRIRLADRARERGDLAEAYALLREVVMRRPQEARVQLALARVFSAGGDQAQSMALYDRLLEREPDHRQALEGAANSALASGDPALARQRVEAFDDAFPESADAAEFKARLAELNGNPGLAEREYEIAAKRRTVQPDDVASPLPRLELIDGSRLAMPLLPRPAADADAWQGVVPQRPLQPRPSAFDTPVAPRNGTDPFAPRQALPGLRLDTAAPAIRPVRRTAAAPKVATPGVRLRVDDALGQPAAPSAPRPRTLAPTSRATAAAPRRGASAGTESSLDRLRAGNSGWLGGALHSRVRDGEGGLSRLFNIETPMEAQSAATALGQFGVRVVPVYLDAGSASGNALLRLGALPLINGGDDAVSLSESGVAVGLTYRAGTFSADVGSTPLGLTEERLTGGVRWAPTTGPWRFAFELARRPVTDSLLSYSGVYDPLLGVNTGAINRTGGRADITYDTGRLGVYGNGGFATYDGRNTDDNAAGELGGGVYVRALRSDVRTLTYGLNITTFFYDKNRRYFTFGHGGYFSPQFFLGVTVPVELSGRWGDVRYRLNGAVGLQTFREDGAALFPNNANLQDELEALIDANPDTNLVGGYASSSQSGLGYALGGALEYRVSPRLFVGAELASDNARDYNEYQFSGFLRYFFHPQIGLPAAPRSLPAHYHWKGR